jgi:hypothetical protein
LSRGISSIGQVASHRGTTKAELTLVITDEYSREGCDSVTTSRGCISPAHTRISANAAWPRGMIAIADTQEHRSQSGRPRVLASNRLSLGSSAVARPTKGAFGVGPSGEDGRCMNRPCDRARESWERIEEKDGRGVG